MRTVGMAVWSVVRYSLFITMLLLSRVVEPVLGVLAGCGLFVFLGCLLFAQNQHQAMWGGLAFGLCSMALTVAWHVVLQALAPDGMVIVSDL